MNKEIKLQSIEAGPFTTRQNRVSFEIPADGVYNLDDSYINLLVTMNVVEQNITGGIGIYPVDMQLKQTTGDNLAYRNTALVKNALLRTQQNGMIENIRRVDQISHVLQLLNKSAVEVDSESYQAAGQVPGAVNVSKYPIYTDINKLGTVKSLQKSDVQVKIKLTDLFDFCAQAIEIDTTKTGAMRIECELNVDKFEIVQTMTSDLWHGSIKDNWGDITSAGPANNITSDNIYTNLDQMPFYVGQKVVVTATHAGAQAPTAGSVINSVTWNADGTITLGFEKNWGNLTSGQSYVSIAVEAANIKSSSSISFSSAELVLNRLAKTSSDFDMIQYSTFSTEETNGNGQTSFQKQFSIEGESDAVVITFPPDAVNDIISSAPVVDYRLRLDNVDLTDRNVTFSTPLHYDRLNMGMTQMGMRLKNLSLFTRLSSVNVYDISVIGGFPNQLIMSPVQQKGQEKFLQVNVGADGAGVEKMTLFKHLPRVFQY